MAQQAAQNGWGIIGVMLESFLVGGQRELTDRSHLTLGQAGTDACK
jgi:phospho-2-dehydro-3-deoxyheptonate aldolase